MAPLLVLLHGFTHTGRSWRPVVQALSERYRALAPDLRGHGEAAGFVPVTLEAVIDDVAALTDGDFALAGYSMGGRIALHVALAMGERVNKLVLVGASPGLADPVERAARRAQDEALAVRFEAMSTGRIVELWEQNPLVAGQPGAREDRLRNTPAGLAAALRGLGTGALPSLWDRLGELAMPATLVIGERDTKFREVAERMARRMVDVRVEVVSGAGHAVHLDAPKAVAALL